MGQVAFHNPVTPPFSVLAAWLFSHSSHVSSRVQEHFYSKSRRKQQQPAFVLWIVALGSKEEYEFFHFPGTKIQKITIMKHQLANIGFLRVKGRDELVALR